MKSGPITIALFFIGRIAFSQNLVPNYSFESFSSCPTFASQLDLAVPWFDPTGNLGGTPEFFHTCAAPSSYVSIPVNLIGGFQYAHTGNGYAGIYTFDELVADKREYTEIQLTSPLNLGQCYYFEMYVNLLNSARWATNGPGVIFSDVIVTANNPNPLPFIASIENPSIISDTLNWTKVSGYYQAQGGEQYLVIGNFNYDNNTSKQLVNSGNPLYTYQAGYYLVDDVTLLPVMLQLQLGDDTTMCEGNSLFLDAFNPLVTEYLWQDGSTQPDYVVAQAGTYWVTVKAGTCEITDTIYVNYEAAPMVNLPDEISIYGGEHASVDVSCSGCSYLWNDGSTSSGYTFVLPGDYWVTVNNFCGGVTDTVSVTEKNDCACQLNVPNAFTPNEDGINDEFFPILSCEPSFYHFRIFNRWGELVFETNDLEEGWDGSFRGTTCGIATFVWVINYADEKGNQKLEKGNVILIR